MQKHDWLKLQNTAGERGGGREEEEREREGGVFTAKKMVDTVISV